jgi:hypothetical protein
VEIGIARASLNVEGFTHSHNQSVLAWFALSDYWSHSAISHEILSDYRVKDAGAECQSLALNKIK